jgi:hypothetical protein
MKRQRHMGNSRAVDDDVRLCTTTQLNAYLPTAVVGDVEQLWEPYAGKVVVAIEPATTRGELSPTA